MAVDPRLVTALACACALDDHLDSDAIREIAAYTAHMFRGTFNMSTPPSGQACVLANLLYSMQCWCDRLLGVDVGDEWWRTITDSEWSAARAEAERVAQTRTSAHAIDDIAADHA
jgi:hypothetical protein